MRCTLNNHAAPGGKGYHLNIVGATAKQHKVMDKMRYLSIIDIKVVSPAKLAEGEQASTNSASLAIAAKVLKWWKKWGSFLQGVEKRKMAMELMNILASTAGK